MAKGLGKGDKRGGWQPEGKCTECSPVKLGSLRINEIHCDGVIMLTREPEEIQDTLCPRFPDFQIFQLDPLS